MALYREAVVALRFQQLEWVNSPTSWTGLAEHRRGTLRLVVQKAGRLHVATLEMKE